jgi:hypothetical protein
MSDGRPLLALLCGCCWPRTFVDSSIAWGAEVAPTPGGALAPVAASGDAIPALCLPVCTEDLERV